MDRCAMCESTNLEESTARYGVHVGKRTIDAQLDAPLGWQELMQHSGLDHQTINALFFKYASTTPMTWIRRRRQARFAAPRHAVPATLALRQTAA